MDSRVLEQHKENIQPLHTGRSALKLASALVEPRHRLKLQREEFENKLKEAEELDDPLQLYVDYIQWTHNHFPQGSNAESGLLNLLERCTSFFRDAPYYKNDPRYLKIWLEYAGYSDLPRDIFVYLAKKTIGSLLALYYEEFARFLEQRGQLDDAQEVYELGIEKEARPLARLERSYSHFNERRNVNGGPTRTPNPVAHIATSMRNVLGLKMSTLPVSKKQRLDIFEDHEGGIRSVFTNGEEPRPLALIATRNKENTMAPTPWAGAIVKQSEQEKPATLRFEVFRDELKEIKEAQDSFEYEVVNENGTYYTMVSQPGKATEKLCVNMKLIHPSSDEEYSFAEMLLLSRKIQITLIEENHTFTIPLRDDDTIARPASPTITMFSRATTNEVLGLFNDAARDFQLDDESAKDETTNFSGFVTETIHVNAVDHYQDAEVPLHNFQREDDVPETPPTDHYDSGSSPFLEQPLHFENPISKIRRHELLLTLSPALSTYSGYHSYNFRKGNSGSFVLEKDSKVIRRDSRSDVAFCGEPFTLKYMLGRGGYGVVYLAEYPQGNLKAVKVEAPAMEWEFYILSALHQRLPDSARRRIVSPEAAYVFQDESYLILNYVPQGTILDVVNMYANQNELVDEAVCIYLTTILLQIVENLHAVGVIHGDLKADNCMVNFESTAPLGDYSPTDAAWNKKGLILIDFGRAIDLTLYGNPDTVQFVSNWETDEQDCPQMALGEPWRFEADYYGIAAIIHTMLFGQYIEVRIENGRHVLKHTWKRYWQTQLWEPIFDLLLNPYKTDIGPDEASSVSNSSAKIADLRAQKQSLQSWLAKNYIGRNLRAKLSHIETELTTKHKKILHSCR